MRFTPSFLHGFVTLFTWLTKKCCEAFLQEMHREVLIGAKQGNSVPGLLLHYITALVIPTTMLVNFITTLSIATGSVVIMITSCVIENFLTCDIQAVDER